MTYARMYTRVYIGTFGPIVHIVPDCGEEGFGDSMIILREASKIIPAVKMNERQGFLHAGHVLKPGRKSLKTTKQMCTGATHS
jgi:hypothetical protein